MEQLKPSERQFTLEEYRLLILDASRLHQRDFITKELGNKLEEIVKINKETVQEITPLEKRRFTLTDIHSTCRDLEIPETYIEKILKNYNPTKEEIKKDIDYYGVKLSEDIKKKLFRKNRDRLTKELESIIEIYKNEIKTSLEGSLPLDKFNFKLRYKKKEESKKDEDDPCIYTYKMIEVAYFYVGIWREQKIEIETKRLFLEPKKKVITKKTLMAKLSYSAGLYRKNPLEFYISADLYDPLFLRATGNKIFELNKKFIEVSNNCRLINSEMTAHYNIE